MKYKVGDHVRIISKHGGVYDLNDIKRFSDCPNFEDAVIKRIEGTAITIGKYCFYESDLLPLFTMSQFYGRLLTKVTKI